MNQSRPGRQLVDHALMRSTGGSWLNAMRANPPSPTSPERFTCGLTNPREGHWFIGRGLVRSILGSVHGTLRDNRPKKPLVSAFAGHCGFHLHTFAGHMEVGSGKDAGHEVACGRLRVGQRGLWAPTGAGHGKVEVRNSAGHTGLGDGDDAVFRQETGHGIDRRGVVRAVAAYGASPCGPRQLGVWVHVGHRRVWHVPSRAIVFRSSYFAGQKGFWYAAFAGQEGFCEG